MRGSCRAQPSTEAKQTDLQKHSQSASSHIGLTHLTGAAGRGLDADCSDSREKARLLSPSGVLDPGGCGTRRARRVRLQGRQKVKYRRPGSRTRGLYHQSRQAKK